ncbi:MAG: RsmE family RNA methyltransferase [Vampirovibrionales bacterium]|nr:RsmE family RNA methyltransferase [Vampirovibrionales bacterium]
MNRHQFWGFLPSPGTPPQAGELIRVEDAAQVHYWQRVRRLSPGQTGGLILGQAPSLEGWHARFKTIENGSACFELLTPLPQPAHRPSITLALALLKQPAWEATLDTATALGVTQIQPVISAHCVAQWPAAGADQEKKLSRWQAIIQAAAVQSERWQTPALLAPLTLQQLVVNPTALGQTFSGQAFSGQAFMVALERSAGAIPLLNALQSPKKAYTLLIGPEGGWSSAERALFSHPPWQPVTLGETILTAPLASLYALSILNAAG